MFYKPMSLGWQYPRISFCSDIYLAKIDRRIKEYNIEELNPPREGKHCLVLDIDYTLFGELEQ